MPDPTPRPKETTLAALAKTLAPQKVTAVTQVLEGDAPDPAWVVVDHPQKVKLHLEFSADATDADRAAAKTAALAAVLKVKPRAKSPAGAAKELKAKLTDPARRERFRNLMEAVAVLNGFGKEWQGKVFTDLLAKWGFGDLVLDETVAL